MREGRMGLAAAEAAAEEEQGEDGLPHSLKTQLRTWQRQTYVCTKGELGAEGPLLVKLGVLMGFTCLRNLLCSGSRTFTLGLGLSRTRLSLLLCRENTCTEESC